MELQTTVRMLAKADKLNGLWVLTEIAIVCSFLNGIKAIEPRALSPETKAPKAKIVQAHIMSVGKAVWVGYAGARQRRTVCKPWNPIGGRKCNRPRAMRSGLWTRIRGLFVTGGGCMMFNATTHRYYCAGAHKPVYKSQKYDQQQSAPDGKLHHFFRRKLVVAFNACHKFLHPV
jgi:hypothetical protein